MRREVDPTGPASEAGRATAEAVSLGGFDIEMLNDERPQLRSCKFGEPLVVQLSSASGAASSAGAAASAVGAAASSAGATGSAAASATAFASSAAASSAGASAAFLRRAP